LTEEEMIAIERFDLFNLGNFIEQQPDADGVAMIKAMFEDSFAGKPYDFASYGETYRAYKVRGGDRPADGETISVVKTDKAKPERLSSAKAPQAESSDEDDSPAAPSADGKSVNDVLSKLRAKHGGKKD
jgi:hypothetical protein